MVAGLAFKASVAPFHQWTPDVYEGAPTPVTGFMAVATKAAAFGVMLRLFDVALIDAATTWAPALATLAVITIVVGNVGAIGQSSLKRLLAYSSVAQAGYMLAGVVVSTSSACAATVFYLAIYVLMNMAAFAVIVARERETGLGDDIASLYGLGATRPWLAWPMTIAMLALAGFPATAGFFGKLYLIEAAVDNGYALARRGDRARLGDLARLLPAGDRGGVDALAVRGAGAAAAGVGRAAGDRRRLGRGGRRARAARRDPGRGRVRGGGLRDGHGRLRRSTPSRCSTSPATRAPRCRPGLAGGELPRGPPPGGVRWSDTTARPRRSTPRCWRWSRPCWRARAPWSGPGEIGAAVVRGVRTGICIVGGDICRASDAAAAGLEPCTVGERHEGGGATVSVAWLRIGGGRELTVATRSDGSVLVTRTAEARAGAGVGLGIEASPLGLEVGVEGAIDFTVARGAAWEFPDARRGARASSPASATAPPTWRFGEAGECSTGERGHRRSAGPRRSAGVEASARAAEGARVGRGRTTLYIRLRLDSGAQAAGRRRHSAGRRAATSMTELTLAGDEPREIAFRTVGRSAGGGQVADTVARLDLRDPANRAAADAAPDCRALAAPGGAQRRRRRARGLRRGRGRAAGVELAVADRRPAGARRRRMCGCSAVWSPPAPGRRARKNACGRTA